MRVYKFILRLLMLLTAILLVPLIAILLMPLIDNFDAPLTHTLRYTLWNTSPAYIMMTSTYSFPHVWYDEVEVYYEGRLLKPLVQKPMLRRYYKVVHLLPGEKYSVFMRLSKFYDISAEGSYLVKVKASNGQDFDLGTYFSTKFEPKVSIKAFLDEENQLEETSNGFGYPFEVDPKGLPGELVDVFRAFTTEEVVYEFFVKHNCDL